MRIAIATAFLAATPALADPGSYGHMSGYGGGMGMMLGPVIWLLVLGAVVAGVIWFVRQTDGTASKNGRADARAELDLRFARGEIDAEDYASRKKLLTE